MICGLDLPLTSEDSQQPWAGFGPPYASSDLLSFLCRISWRRRYRQPEEVSVIVSKHGRKTANQVFYTSASLLEYEYSGSKMEDLKHPLAEVFGHLPTDLSQKATRYRKSKLCPFNNKVPSCTKDKAKNPLGVCSVHSGDGPVITCPVRFREDWLIVEDAADFFFTPDSLWTSLAEVRLTDGNGSSAGNIDVVLVSYDQRGNVTDFGSLEVQAVYISGNIREPFTHYMEDCQKNKKMDWTSQPNYPRPDFLSSSRKRLAPQLMFKGGILHQWNKRMAVALDSPFFRTLPSFQEVSKQDADIAWFIYDLVPTDSDSRYALQKTKTVYTRFTDVLNTITRPQVGKVDDFLRVLQAKVDEKLESPPANQTVDSPFSGR